VNVNTNQSLGFGKNTLVRVVSLLQHGFLVIITCIHNARNYKAWLQNSPNDTDR